MNTIMRLLALFVLFPLLSPTPAAQTVMPWCAADAGGAQRSVGAAMTLRSSVAQTCAGRASEVPHQVVTGFLAVTAAGGGGQPVMEVLPDPLAFGTIAIGASGTQVLTVRNTGTGPLRIIGMTVTPAVYSLVSGHGARNINPGASATVELRFTPAAEGPVDGTLRIESNWEGHPFVDVTLTGSGLREAADLVFSETSIDFGDVTLGLGVSKSITARNNGNIACTVSNQGLEGPGMASFQITNLCSGSIAPGGSDVVTIRFVPTAEGAVGARYVVESNDSDQPRQEIQLSGRGVTQRDPDISVAPMQKDFGTKTVGGEVTADIEIRNTGQGELHLLSQTLTGEGFELRSQADVIIAAGASSPARIAFVPPREGTFTGSFVIASNDPDEGTVTVGLQGSGVAPQTDPKCDLSVASIDFGSVQAGTPAEREVTIRNLGGTDLELSDFRITDPGPYTAPSDFSLAQYPSSPVAPARSTTLRIRLSGTATCQHKEARFRMRTNDPTLTEVDIPLEADVITDVGDPPAVAAWWMSQNYPNPCADRSTVEFSLPESSQAELSVYDLLGRRRMIALQGHTPAGRHSAMLDLRGLPAGQYFCRLEAGAGVIVRILTVLR